MLPGPLCLSARCITQIPIVLVGNKVDLENERRVTKAQGQQLAEEYDVPFFETSALKEIGCKEVFEQAVREIRKYHASRRTVQQPKSWFQKLCQIL